MPCSNPNQMQKRNAPSALQCYLECPWHAAVPLPRDQPATCHPLPPHVNAYSTLFYL